MGNLSILRIDYNGDIAELVDLLRTMTRAKDDITQGRDAFSPNYAFYSELWDAVLTLHENPAVYDEGSPYSTCRFYLEIDGVDQLRCMRDLCTLLRGQDTLAFEVREVFNMPEITYYPASFKTDYAVVTRHMPAVIMMKTRLSNKQLVAELRRVTGLSTWEMNVVRPEEGVMYAFCRLTEWHRRPEFREYHGGFQASHRIQIFALDDESQQRRRRRDAFAQSLHDKISESNRLEARIFEVVTGRVCPLGTTSDD